jgi:transposase, IS30 family
MDMSHNHLSIMEREQLALFSAKGESWREIAKRLNRSPSTISRELRRNGIPSGYLPSAAQMKATNRSRGRPPKKMDSAKIAHVVKAKLKQDHSPEVISGRLKAINGGISIGRQTIYNWIYSERMHGRKWHRYLPRRGKPYFQKRSGTTRDKGRKSISERPEVVETRDRLGDWEGDTLEGRKGGDAVITLVERKSRCTVLSKVKDHSSAALNRSVREWFRYKRGFPRETLTVDRGGEFADGKELAKAFRADVYFADAHSPWQKGAVEQVNGLLRRYFPKGFDTVSESELDLAMERLNNRPRKCLGFLTPYEVLFDVMPM